MLNLVSFGSRTLDPFRLFRSVIHLNFTLIKLRIEKEKQSVKRSSVLWVVTASVVRFITCQKPVLYMHCV